MDCATLPIAELALDSALKKGGSVLETGSVFFLWKETVQENPDLQLERYRDDLTAGAGDEVRFEISLGVIGDQYFRVVRVQRGVPDHSLVSASARFTALWPGPVRELKPQATESTAHKECRLQTLRTPSPVSVSEWAGPKVDNDRSTLSTH